MTIAGGAWGLVSALHIGSTASSRVWTLRELQRLDMAGVTEWAPFCVGILYSCRPHACTKQESPNLSLLGESGENHHVSKPESSWLRSHRELTNVWSRLRGPSCGPLA